MKGKDVRGAQSEQTSHTHTSCGLRHPLPRSIPVQSQVSYLSVFTSGNLFRRAGGGE